MTSKVFALLFNWRVTTDTGMTKAISEALQASAWSSALPQVKLRSLKVNRVGVSVNTPNNQAGVWGRRQERKESSEESKKMREKICLFEMDEFLLIVEFENWGEGRSFGGSGTRRQKNLRALMQSLHLRDLSNFYFLGDF